MLNDNAKLPVGGDVAVGVAMRLASYRDVLSADAMDAAALSSCQSRVHVRVGH